MTSIPHVYAMQHSTFTLPTQAGWVSAHGIIPSISDVTRLSRAGSETSVEQGKGADGCVCAYLEISRIGLIL